MAVVISCLGLLKRFYITFEMKVSARTTFFLYCGCHLGFHPSNYTHIIDKKCRPVELQNPGLT